MRLVLMAALILREIASGQALPPPPAGTNTAEGKPAPAAVLDHVASDKRQPTQESPNIAPRTSFWDFFAPYRRPTAPPLKLGPADRARSLIRDGVIYLSLYDAMALAIENNLDVEVARYGLSIAGTEVLRASGGGTLRGIDYSVAESSTGVGGPGSPLLNSAASSVTPNTPTINDLTSLNELTETQTNLSVQGTSGYAAGPTLPTFQPTFIGQNTWFQRSNSIFITPIGSGSGGSLATPGTLNFGTANYALVQGFSYGTQVEVDLNNASQALFANTP
ncbi:MAG: hypothetical protein M3Y72_24490, partial [Acidobacteriota bacterium]|nr:hypothetical protein [Acidobacteriota bacterium]